MRVLLSLISSLTIAALVTAGCGDSSTEAEPQQPASSDWSYEGASGPAHWADLDADYELCESGHHQSPINLKNARRARFPKLHTDYFPEQIEVEDNGHAIEAVVKDPDSSITVAGRRYWLKQFHVHTPSEELINGRRYPAVVHMVHISDSDQIAVLAVLVRPGAANPAFDFEIPESPGSVSDLEDELDPSVLLPESDLGYRYQGSLTTPPCTEGVIWTVLKQPITVSPSQLDALRSAHPENDRPIQPLNQRTVMFGPAVTK